MKAHLGRWRSAQILSWSFSHLGPDVLEKDLPLLETLAVTATLISSDRMITFRGGSRLRTISFSVVYFSFENAILPGLESLSIKDASVHPPTWTPHLVKALATSHCLRELDLEDIRNDAWVDTLASIPRRLITIVPA